VNNFKDFLEDSGILDADELIGFLENLPEDPEIMDCTEEVEEYQDQIDQVFEMLFND
jgi:hypothetical protein